MKVTRDPDILKISASSGMKWMGYALGFSLIAALVTVWVISTVIFSAFDYIRSRLNERKDKPHISKRRLFELERLFAIAWICTISVLNVSQAQSLTPMEDSASDSILSRGSSNSSIWQSGIGDGFNPSTQSISLNMGAGYGERILGSRENHHLALSGIAYGHMLGGVQGKGHWYKGNWEWRGELFSGAQFSPTRDWLVGLAPHLRYNFATGHRWIPYCDLGAGVSATGIGPPDLSHTFEFNLQAAAGVRWFLKKDVALSVEARYLHLSCAGMDSPNLGLNNVNGMLGISWFF